LNRKLNVELVSPAHHLIPLERKLYRWGHRQTGTYIEAPAVPWTLDVPCLGVIVAF